MCRIGALDGAYMAQPLLIIGGGCVLCSRMQSVVLPRCLCRGAPFTVGPRGTAARQYNAFFFLNTEKRLLKMLGCDLGEPNPAWRGAGCSSEQITTLTNHGKVCIVCSRGDTHEGKY